MPLTQIKEYLHGKVDVEQLMTDDALVSAMEDVQQISKGSNQVASANQVPALDAIRQLPLLAQADEQRSSKVAAEIKFIVDRRQIL